MKILLGVGKRNDRATTIAVAAFALIVTKAACGAPSSSAEMRRRGRCPGLHRLRNRKHDRTYQDLQRKPSTAQAVTAVCFHANATFCLHHAGGATYPVATTAQMQGLADFAPKTLPLRFMPCINYPKPFDHTRSGVYLILGALLTAAYVVGRLLMRRGNSQGKDEAEYTAVHYPFGVGRRRKQSDQVRRRSRPARRRSRAQRRRDAFRHPQSRLASCEPRRSRRSDWWPRPAVKSDKR
jgi:hypothetical protein